MWRDRERVRVNVVVVISAALPDLAGLVYGPGDDKWTRSVEVDGGDEVRVRVGHALGAPPVRDVPDAQTLVVGGGQQVLAARVPAERAHPVVVAGQGHQAHPRRHVPYFDRLIT